MNRKRKYTLCKIVEWIVLLVITIIYGIQLYLAYQSTQVLGLPKIMGWGEVVFLSGSMEPEIKTGSLSVVHEQKEYYEQDVVTYFKDETLITHRIVEKREDGKYIVQGDANNTPDDPITKDMIEGKVMISIPYAGTVLNYMKTPYGMAGIAAIAVLIAMWPELEKDKPSGNMSR